MNADLDKSTLQLSAIFPFMGAYELARNTVEHLRHQTIASSMELLLVKESGYDAGIPPDWCAGFAAGQIVETDPFTTRSKAFAEGVRCSASNYVVMCEDHCFPEPGWAESLVARLREGHAVVGAGFHNSNPENAISWADFFLAYGPFVYPGNSERRSFLPGHNSAYRKSVLTNLSNLDHELEVEYLLHIRLATEGNSLFLDSTARTHHTNFATWKSFCVASFYASKVFGAIRAGNQTRIQNIKFVALSFLVPPLRLWRAIPSYLRAQAQHRIPISTLLVLFIGYILSTAGEVNGMLFGADSTRSDLLPYEFDRLAHAPRALEELRHGGLRFY